MTDKLSPAQRSRNIRRIRSKDTSIELKLRKALWREGIRYRKNYSQLPGHPDIAITKYKVAVFCDGSFFHGRNYNSMKKPQTNTEFWEKKIKRNMERDREVNSQLAKAGWTVLRFWDTDINKNLCNCVKTVKRTIVEIKNSCLTGKTKDKLGMK